MKVLLSAYGCNPSRGGEFQFGWNWARYNALQGNEVWCMTTHWGKEHIEKALAEEPLPNLHFEYVEVPDWVEKSYVNKLGVYLHYLKWQQRALQKARELDAKIDFDVVHHATYGSLQLGSALGKLGKPMIFGPVGGGQFPLPQFKKYFYHGWREETVRKRVSSLLVSTNPNFKQVVKQASLILTCNQETGDIARSHGAKNVELFLDTGLPEDFYPPERPIHRQGKTLKLLWVGRVIPRKGLPLVLEALGRLPKDMPYEFTIIGDGPMGEKIPEWIQMYGLEGKVDWRGRVPWEEVKTAMATHDAFLFCTLRDSFASQFLEAMAYGLPIICLNTHGARDFIPNDAGIKIEPGTVEETLQAVADAVRYMYEQPEVYETMSRTAFEFASQFTWTIRAKKMNDRYRKILGLPEVERV